MLPSSKRYLIRSGLSESNAAWILLGCFIGGVIGVQVLSRFLHHHIPSQVVDCDHTHEDLPHDHEERLSKSHAQNENSNGATSEVTPLLNSGRPSLPTVPMRGASQVGFDGTRSQLDLEPNRRPSVIVVPSRVMSYIAEQIKDHKPNCDEGGPCFGYSEPCGQECLKHLSKRKNTFPLRGHGESRFNTVPLLRSATDPSFRPSFGSPTADPDLESASTRAIRSISSGLGRPRSEADDLESQDGHKSPEQHHHHVPENAFLSIGLQTSIAIALHKIPEGFITYATNHANPSLGFSVFMALFVHNITEGYALALPLYLALHSRFKAMFWASLLGGVSQPFGAGVAVAWFKVAGHDGHEPGPLVYGCMFGATAGVMTSVALQLFVEGLSLGHNKNLCMAFAFVGMAIMGTSNALTAS
jgi:ZIP family zinc transporter